MASTSHKATGPPEPHVGTREETWGPELSVRRNAGKGATEDGSRRIDQTPVSLHLWLQVGGPDHSFPHPGRLGDNRLSPIPDLSNQALQGMVAQESLFLKAQQVVQMMTQA